MEWTGWNVVGWLSSVVGTDIYEVEILSIKDEGKRRIIILMNNLVTFYHLEIFTTHTLLLFKRFHFSYNSQFGKSFIYFYCTLFPFYLRL